MSSIRSKSLVNCVHLLSHIVFSELARYAAFIVLGLCGLRLYLIHTLVSLRRALSLVIRVPPPKPSLRLFAAAAGGAEVLDNLAVQVVHALDDAADEHESALAGHNSLYESISISKISHTASASVLVIHTNESHSFIANSYFSKARPGPGRWRTRT
jgi:hypothetical protein